MQRSGLYLAVGLTIGALLALALNFALAQDKRSAVMRILIIDTGVDFREPALAEVGCPIDESFDAVAGVYGSTRDVARIGHGTHVAGIIRAIAGNSGYCLASCRYYVADDPGYMNIVRESRCIEHARQMGATIANISGGGAEVSELERLAIRHADKVLFVVAAGNEGIDLDDPSHGYYPASYGVDNVIPVGALGMDGKKLKSSNYGKKVLVWMPGENIYSAFPDGRRARMSGTSMATAVAAGVILRSRLGLRRLPKLQEFIINFWRSH